MQIIDTRRVNDSGALPLIAVTVALDRSDKALMANDWLSHLQPTVIGRDPSGTTMRFTVRCACAADAVAYISQRLDSRTTAA